jgi:hypothetical protein
MVEGDRQHGGEYQWGVGRLQTTCQLGARWRKRFSQRDMIKRRQADTIRRLSKCWRCRAGSRLTNTINFGAEVVRQHVSTDGVAETSPTTKQAVNSRPDLSRVGGGRSAMQSLMVTL